jgi:hypothetical protein
VKDYLSGVVMFKDVCTKEWALHASNVAAEAATASPARCLTKEYPGTGTVLFKDVCTNEWAMKR